MYMYMHVNYISYMVCTNSVTGSVSVGHAAGGERVHREGHGVQECLATCQGHRTESN